MNRRGVLRCHFLTFLLLESFLVNCVIAFPSDTINGGVAKASDTKKIKTESTTSKNVVKEQPSTEIPNAIKINANITEIEADGGEFNLFSRGFLNWIYPTPSILKQNFYRWFFNGIIAGGVFVQYDTVKRQIIITLKKILTQWKKEKAEREKKRQEAQSYYNNYNYNYGYQNQEYGYQPSVEDSKKETPEYQPSDGGIKEEKPEYKPLNDIIEEEKPEYKPSDGDIKEEKPEYQPSDGDIKEEKPEYQPSDGGIKEEKPEYKPFNGIIEEENPEYKPSDGDIKEEKPKYQPSDDGIKEEKPEYKPLNAIIEEEKPEYKPSDSFIEEVTPDYQQSSYSSYDNRFIEKRRQYLGGEQPINSNISSSRVRERLTSLTNEDCFQKGLCQLEKLRSISPTMARLWLDIRNYFSSGVSNDHLPNQNRNLNCETKYRSCHKSTLELIKYLLQ